MIETHVHTADILSSCPDIILNRNVFNRIFVNVAISMFVVARVAK